MCQKHQRRCSALLEIREKALAEWGRAETLHDVLACWGRLGGRVTLHRYGRGHFSELARRRPTPSATFAVDLATTPTTPGRLEGLPAKVQTRAASPLWGAASRATTSATAAEVSRRADRLRRHKVRRREHDEGGRPRRFGEEFRASDVYLSELTDEEQLADWTQAVGVLNDLGKLGETLMSEALIVALADAEWRAKEEARRVADRLSRPEGEDLHPRERERLTEMMNRCDAFSNAYYIVEATAIDNADLKTITLQVLKELHEEASAHFDRYRREVGLKD